MRQLLRSSLFTATLLLAGATVLPSAVRAQTPIISGTAGSGVDTYYFVMDFNDFAAPQAYAFTYLSNSPTLSFESILVGLESVPTFSATIVTGSAFGDSLNGLAYSGKTKFNDFAGNNSGQPNGYWSQWNGTNGVSWVENAFGISGQTVSAGQWVGASWTGDFTTEVDTAPRTPFAAAATPEPATAALAAIGGLSIVAPVARRRRRA